MMLYVVATPIGNVLDASPHLTQVLSSVSFILCEDTRKTRRLLTQLSIPHPHLISCHAHNEEFRIQRAMEELSQGKSGALVSDAGTPAVSDPGMYIVQEAHRRNIPVSPIVGASSVSTAISVAGFPTPPFHFLGFPPRKKGKRKSWIVELSRLDGVCVLFEAGNRFASLIEALQELMPNREACLCRELTKTHQEIIRQPIHSFTSKNVLGEVTLVIGPGEAIESPKQIGQGEKGIAAQLATEWNITKREAYNLLMKIKPNG